MVDRRCAIAITVVSPPSSASAACTSRSVSLSMRDVASSRNSTRGRPRARARRRRAASAPTTGVRRLRPAGCRSPFQALDEGVRARRARGRLDPRVGQAASHVDVLAHAGREQERLLRHEPDLGAEVAVVDLRRAGCRRSRCGRFAARRSAAAATGASTCRFRCGRRCRRSCPRERRATRRAARAARDRSRSSRRRARPGRDSMRRACVTRGAAASAAACRRARPRSPTAAGARTAS